MPRHLPVIQAPSPDDAAALRPEWQWICIGAVLDLSIWGPLLMLALPVALRASARLGEPHPAASAALAALLVIVTFSAASFAAGLCIGRFGGVRPARATLSAVIVAVFAAGLEGALGPTPRVVLAATALGLSSIGAFFAATGARLGGRRRGSSQPS